VVERGFASDTTGYWFIGKPHPGGMPDAHDMGFWHPSGMHLFFYSFPVVSLAKPRATTG
jgi:hypothetical protein